MASGDGGRMTCDVRRVGAAAVHHRSTSTAKNDCATNRLTSPSSVAHAVPAPPCRRPCFTAGIDTARRRRRRRQCKLTRQRAVAYVTRTAGGGSRIKNVEAVWRNRNGRTALRPKMVNSRTLRVLNLE